MIGIVISVTIRTLPVEISVTVAKIKKMTTANSTIIQLDRP